MPRDAKIQVRRDSAANWTSVNPTLAAGEVGYETDTAKMKIGDGATAWTSLGYFVTDATTSVKGIVQLTDSTSSTSTTTAATPNAVKSAYDLANGKPSLSSNNPVALGTAAAGTGTAASKDDHVHPTTGLAVLAAANTFTGGVQQINTASAATKGLIVKGSSGQSVNLFETQNSAGTILARISDQGSFFSESGTILRGVFSGQTWATRLAGASASVTPVVVLGFASQTADLQQWQNSAGTVLAFVNSIGRATFGSSTSPGAYSLRVDAASGGGRGILVRDTGASGAAFIDFQNSGGTTVATVTTSGNVRSAAIDSVTGNTPYIDFTTSGKLNIYARSSTYVGLTILSAASQTANLQEWQNNVGGVLAKVDANGNATFVSIDGGTS